MPGVTIIAIIAVVMLESVALALGVNGAMLGLALTLIAGLGGYAVGLKRHRK